MPLDSKSTPDTILLKGTGRRREALLTAVALLPGKLVEMTSAGTVQANSAAAGTNEEAAFAVEDELQGNEIGDTYDASARCFYHVMDAGEEVFAWLDAGEDVAIGAFLESAGNGNLQAVTTPGTNLAMAIEAVDLSASGAVAARIKVRIV